MGVIGLTSFVDDHPELLTDHRLHDMRVLIDGNNLYYFLYYRYFNINARYGGDYDHYATSVRYYFTALKSCNIAPYVIFDGGYDMDERKLKTTMKRQKSRLSQVNCLAKGQKGQVFPLLASDVFRQVLDEMKVSHMTCDFEADDQLAALAKSWQCPVMSNDSDFFIFDMPEGFIIFDYLDLEIKHCAPNEDPDFPDGYSYLSVQLYKLSNLERSFKGLQRSMLPIFATLIGNDFVDPTDFENFFARVKLPKVGSARNRHQQKRQKMTGLLMWLADQESLEHTMNYIVNCFPDGKRKKARSSLENSVKSYMDVSSHLSGYFDEEECRYKTRTKLQTHSGNPVPYWIVSGLRKAEIPVFIINTLTLHRNILLPQMELVTEPSSYICSESIRRVIYSILLTLDSKLNERPAAKKDKPRKEVHIQEYLRYINDLNWVNAEPMSQLPGGSPVPYLQKIPHLSREEREAVFWETVGADGGAFQGLPPSLHITLAAICFWVVHSTPKVSPHFVYSLVACVIRLAIATEVPKRTSDTQNEQTVVTKIETDKVDVNKEITTSDEDVTSKFEDVVGDDNKTLQENDKVVNETLQNNTQDPASEILNKCTPEERECAKRNTERFTVETKHNSTDNRFCTLITHNYSQFQTCLYSLMHLNRLLLHPLADCAPALVFNGTFVYNLCHEVQRRSQPKTYICEQFGVKSSLSVLYMDIVDSILNVVPEDAFLSVNVSKKKSKKKRSKKESSECHEDSQEEQENSSKSDTDQYVSANCSLTNKFSGLLLENE